jgi:nucleoside-diphosphate kinase
MEGELQQTLVLLKPDAVQRGLVGEITGRLEQRGLKLVGAKLVQVDSALAENHYAIHKGKPFYEGLIAYITSSPVIAMVWEGPSAIEVVRQTMGATNPKEASPGSVRHDLGLEIGRNLTHASDAPQTAKEEIQLWFSEVEVVNWSRETDRWIYES